MEFNVCFLIQQYNNSGGTERVLSQIANELVEKGHKVSIVSISKGLSPHFATDGRIKLFDLEDYNIPWPQGILGKALRKFTFLKAVSKKVEGLEKILNEINPDFVIAVDVVLYHYIERLRKKMNFKAIAWEHYCLDAREGRFVRYCQKLATKKADKVIVLGDRDLEDYQTRYPRSSNIKRIYNPIAFEISNNIDVNNKVVIAAGRYSYQKGFDMLLESWEKIADRVPDWELRIFGDGEEKENFQSFILQNGLKNVKLCGYTDCLDKEMDKASVFALSSRYEGFVLVLLEAQARGLPCVSFNCKQGPSEIIDNNINGFLVSPNDVDAFSEKLYELMTDNDLRSSFSKNAQKDLYRFEMQTVIKEWEDLFNELSME